MRQLLVIGAFIVTVFGFLNNSYSGRARWFPINGRVLDDSSKHKVMMTANFGGQSAKAAYERMYIRMGSPANRPADISLPGLECLYDNSKPDLQAYSCDVFLDIYGNGPSPGR